MIAQKMTMRCELQKNRATDDPYGQPGPPEWKTVDNNLRCYVWETTSQLIKGGLLVEAGTPMMVCKKSADITTESRIINVIDRSGEVLYPLFYVDGIFKRRNHLQVKLKRVE